MSALVFGDRSLFPSSRYIRPLGLAVHMPYYGIKVRVVNLHFGYARKIKYLNPRGGCKMAAPSACRDKFVRLPVIDSADTTDRSVETQRVATHPNMAQQEPTIWL